MKRATYFFTEKQLKQLSKLSKDTGLSVSELVRRAVDEYLEKRKNE